MGSVYVDDVGGRDQSGPGSAGQTNGDGFRSFKVLGLESGLTSTSTGMRDEILLLSWLIILLRTREESQICYDWAYKGRGSVVEGELMSIRLSTDEVMTGLKNKVGQIAATISRHIMRVAPSLCTATCNPASLLLSTGSLSQTSDGAKSEVSKRMIQLIISVKLTVVTKACASRRNTLRSRSSRDSSGLVQRKHSAIYSDATCRDACRHGQNVHCESRRVN